jgi:short-subunit dehydrogenase
MAPLAFITGASSGIGQALAARCYRAGYRLALVARRGADMQAWVGAQGFEPARVAIHAADVRDVEALAALGRACLATHGVPDIVVANAGISVGIDTARFEDLDVMRATLETNLLGMAATFHPFLAPMRERRNGRLVGVASMAGIRGLPGHGAYCASKAGVMAYCESLRGECRPYGVKVVTLVPGYVDTPLTRANRYGMPFLMDADRFADQAFDAIVAGARRRVIPWQMAVVARLLRALPDAALDALLAGRPRKRRQGE